MSIEIYCDAGSNLYPAFLKQKNYNIHVFSMNVILNGKTYHCYDDDIDPEAVSKEYYASLDPRKKNVHTSLVSPGDYQETFLREAKAGNQVVCFCMAKPETLSMMRWVRKSSMSSTPPLPVSAKAFRPSKPIRTSRRA